MKRIITLLFALLLLCALPAFCYADETASLADNVVEYEGVASRITTYPGLRSLWRMNKTAVASLEDMGYDVYVGSIMGIETVGGTIRKPHDLAVAYQNGSVVLAKGIQNAAIVTVYAPDGAGTRLYTQETGNDALFAYTTIFSDAFRSAEYYELSLVYAAFTVLVDENGNATYYYDYPSGTELGYALDTYEKDGKTFYAGIDLYTVSEYFVNRYEKADAQKFFENEVLRDVLFACGDISDLSSLDGFAKAASDKVTATVGNRQVETVNFASGVQNMYSFRYTAEKAGYYDIALAYALVGGDEAPLMKARSQFSDSAVLSGLLSMEAPAAVGVEGGYTVPKGTDYLENATVSVYLEEGENVVNLWQDKGSPVVLSRLKVTLQKEFAPLEADSVLGTLDLRQRADGRIETYMGEAPNGYFPTGTILTGTNLGAMTKHEATRDRVLTLPAGAYIDYVVGITYDKLTLASILSNHTEGAFKIYDVTGVTDTDYTQEWTYTAESGAFLVFSSGNVKNVDAVGEADYYDFGKIAIEQTGKRVYRLYAESEISISELRLTDVELKVLTVVYTDASGNTVAPTREYVLNKGETYSVTSPYVEGMTPDKVSVSGTLLDNTVITVTYVEKAEEEAPKQSITYTPAELWSMATNTTPDYPQIRYDANDGVLYMQGVGHKDGGNENSFTETGFNTAYGGGINAYITLNVNAEKEGVYGIYVAQKVYWENASRPEQSNQYMKYSVHNCTLGGCTYTGNGRCTSADTSGANGNAGKYGYYNNFAYYPKNLIAKDNTLNFATADYDMSSVTLGDTPLLFVYLREGENRLRFVAGSKHNVVIAGINAMKIELVSETTENDVHIMAQDASRTASALAQTKVPENNVLRLAANQWVEYSFAVAESGYYALHSLMGGGGYNAFTEAAFNVSVSLAKNGGELRKISDYQSNVLASCGNEGTAEHKLASAIYLESGAEYKVRISCNSVSSSGGLKLHSLRFMKDTDVFTRDLTFVGGRSEELSETLTVAGDTLVCPEALLIDGYNVYFEDAFGTRIVSTHEVENGGTVYVRYESITDFEIRMTDANMALSKGVSFLASDPALLHIPTHTSAPSNTMANNSYYVALTVTAEYSGIYAISLRAVADGEYDLYAGISTNNYTYISYVSDYDTALSATERWFGASDGAVNYMYLPKGESTVWLAFRGTGNVKATYVDLHSVRFTLLDGRNDGTDYISRLASNNQTTAANAYKDFKVTVAEEGYYDLYLLLGSANTQTVTVSTVNGETVTPVATLGPQVFGTSYKSAFPYKTPSVWLPAGETTLRVSVAAAITTTIQGVYVVPTPVKPEPEPITSVTYTAEELAQMAVNRNETAFRYDEESGVLYVKSIGPSGVYSGFRNTNLNAYLQVNVTVEKEGVYGIYLAQTVKYNSNNGTNKYIKYNVHNCTLSGACTEGKCVAASASGVSASAAAYGGYIPHTYYPQNMLIDDTSLTLDNASYDMSGVTVGDTPILYVYLQKGENSLRIVSHNRHTLVVAGITEMKIELLTETTEDTVQVMAQDASKTFTVKTTSGLWAESTKQDESGVVRMATNNTLSYTFSVNKTGYYDLYSLMGGGGYANYDNQKFIVEIRIGEENGASTVYDDDYTSTEKSGGGDEGVAEHMAIEGVYLEQDKTYRIEFKPTELYEGGGFKLMDMRFIYRGEAAE